MKHVDNTVCIGVKNSVPSKAKIAYYWREDSHLYFDYLMDWAEPSCWACGIFDGELDIDVSESEVDEIFEVWDNHHYLQRCHILPKALGGCNCEANLVLLCRRCHKLSPDTKDPTHFINWVKNKKKILTQEIEHVMTLLEYSPEENDSNLLLTQEFKEYYRENSVIISGSRPLSTFLACFLEFKKVHIPKFD